MTVTQQEHLALTPIYTGSVKTVSQNPASPATAYFAFSDDYSVFDWGKMPDQLTHKGKALSLLGGYFFQSLENPDTWQALPKALEHAGFKATYLEACFVSPVFQQLKQAGMPHHFLAWADETGKHTRDLNEAAQWEKPFLHVQHVQVNSPRAFSIESETVYDYKKSLEAPFLIPLEVVFRFGMPQGSSLQQRLDSISDYAKTLGLQDPPQPNTRFSRPVIEFFTKLEPTDRFLPLQAALFISGLKSTEFTQLYQTAQCLALWLFSFFQKAGLELWDGKFEFAWTQDGLMLVDSIGPDELRLLANGKHLSKELIRQFYRGSAWEQATQQAKTLAKSHPGADWKAYCVDTLKQQPEPLLPEQKAVAQALYPMLLNTLTHTTVFSDTPYLADWLTRLEGLS